MNTNENQTVETLLTLMREILKTDINIDSSQVNVPQWDSLKHIEIVFAVEDEFGIHFLENEFENLTSVRKFIQAISAHNGS